MVSAIGPRTIRSLQEPRKFNRRLDLHLLEDVGPVHFDSAHADAQLVSDDLVHFSSENFFQHFAFACRQRRQPRLHSLVLNPGAWGIGRSIAEIDLERFGVAVTAIRRRGIRAISPAPEARFEAGDVVVLMGVPDALAAGENRLLQG